MFTYGPTRLLWFVAPDPVGPPDSGLIQASLLMAELNWTRSELIPESGLGWNLGVSQLGIWRPQ